MRRGVLPLYRQERHLKRFGISIPQMFVNGITYEANTCLSLIYDHLHAHLLD
ncbi:transposase [Virgibacillus sp. Bac330]|uniref:IS66 family transposase n=1 Tax=Virgibacillus sp. Bac330 TaxID=2419841 RepID=UPI00352B7227